MTTDTADDPLIAAIDRAAPFADRDWTPDARKLKPSTIIAVRYCVLMASDEVDHAALIVRNWLERLRVEWRASTAPIDQR